MTLDVTWLGHSTVVIDVAGVRLVTDPLLGRHAGVLRRRARPPAATATAGADVVLLSHLHHDHAEVASLRALHPAPVVVDRLNAPWLRKKGLDPGASTSGSGTTSDPASRSASCPRSTGTGPCPTGRTPPTVTW